MNLLQSFVIAFAMYSKIPMPRVIWNEKNMKYAMCFFPAVGIVTGICVYLLGGILLKSPVQTLFFCVAMTLLPILINGGIHLDGFMDTMDALSSYGDREKKLEILKDPNSGAFAVIGICCYLLVSLALWSEVDSEMLVVIGCGYVLSRALSGLSVVAFTAAKDSGLAKTFQDGAHRRVTAAVMVAYIVATSAVMIYYSPVMAAGAILLAGVSFGYHAYVCKRKFGGITGDLAGYFLQICELLILAGTLAGGLL